MRLPLCVALASLCGCSPPPRVGERVEPIINGTPDTGDPAVMLMLAVPATSNRVGVCTATLISPHVLLTAAHCVDPQVFQMDMATPPPLTFYVSQSNSIDFTQKLDLSTFLPVATTFCDPAFNPDQNVFVANGHDVGAIMLQTPLALPPVPYNKSALSQSLVGQPARIIGYGVTSGSDSTAKTAGTKREASITIDSVTPLYVTFGDNSHGICEGDSGGPALVMLGGIETIIGVTAFGQMGCPVTTPSDDTRIDTYASEIDGWVATAEGGGPIPAPCNSGAGGGGSGGTGGSSGGGGSSGSGGSGGSGLAGGHSGCDVGGGGPSLPALLLVGAALLALARRRRV